MPHLDRDSFIALLDRLGDPDEAEVLATAREIDRRVRESGMTWSELLALPPPPHAAAVRAMTIIAAPSPMTICSTSISLVPGKATPATPP